MKASLSRDMGRRLLKVSLAIVVIAFSFFLIKNLKSFAQVDKPVSTTVTIGNAAPVFTAGPIENPTSSTSTPTPSGNQITFQATATDANGQPYFLTVCSTDSITPKEGVAGAGDCATDKEYCKSAAAVASGTQNSCAYTTGSQDAFSNPWFAFVCDNDATDSACSPAGQGTGDSGSPFVVNHVPTFTAISNNSPKEPGETVTWTATASDVDAGSTIKLLVCKSAGITAAGACTGDSWCESTAVASNPTCGYNIPSVEADGNNNAWVYVVDQYNTPATGVAQGTQSNFTVSNVRPTVTAVSINGGLAINLTESTTTSVPITATVTDKNGCSTSEITTVTAYAYRSDLSSTCTADGALDGNECYKATCIQDVGSCSAGNGSATYTCTASFQYYADATDANTPNAALGWAATVYANDENTTAPLPFASSPEVELNSLIAFTVTPSINYGTLGIGESNDPLDKILTTTPTGNTSLSQSHHGTQMCIDSPTCSGGTPIAAAQQRYGLTGVAYASGTTLKTSIEASGLHIPKVNNGTVTTKNTYWGISIPAGILPGAYTGQNTITGNKASLSDWL